ncbi:MAG: extracellular solute-binding protein [Candidatus Gracilibacteria bacterium]
MKKYLATLVLITLISTTGSGCLKKDQTTTTKTENIELTMYGLFDDSTIFQPIIQAYESEHTNVKITYKQFTDPSSYLDLVINELAEGEGPDIFAMHNSWIYEHYKKVNPMDSSLMTAQELEDTFVQTVSDDFLRTYTDAEGNSVTAIYGLPLYVDTIALYYNQDQFEDAIPSRGEPSTTWEGIKDDVFKLTKTDNSFERFEQAGIAMGRSDNILRFVDILYTLFLQYGTQFYDDEYKTSTITSTEVSSTSGVVSPGKEALDLFTSFGIPSNKNYSWNEYISDPLSEEQEMMAFVEGKASMILGYSYLYEQLVNLIETEQKKGTSTIDADTIKITDVPQVYDPETSTEKRDVYASYFAYTVSRTSEYPDEAWDFLEFLTSAENEQYYFEETHRPSSRRDLLEEQMKDPVYGVFAKQVGFAETIPIADAEKYEEIFKEAISSVLATVKVETALSTAEEQINAIMPTDGLFPNILAEE